MIPFILAVFACCLAGGLGGYALVRPRDALALRGLTPGDQAARGLAMARSFGAMLLLAHGGTAGMLGYYPSLGATMALALSLLWAGSAMGRLISGALDGHADAADVQVLILEVLMGVTLALPFWAGRQLTGGPTINV